MSSKQRYPNSNPVLFPKPRCTILKIIQGFGDILAFHVIVYYVTYLIFYELIFCEIMPHISFQFCFISMMHTNLYAPTCQYPSLILIRHYTILFRSILFFFYHFLPLFLPLLAECVVELEKEGGGKEMGSSSRVGDKQVNRG